MADDVGYERTQRLTGSLFGGLVYSPDDGGYYVEVWDEEGGDVYCTGIYPVASSAWDDAKQAAVQETAVSGV
jgi:hypothetical protein